MFSNSSITNSTCIARDVEEEDNDEDLDSGTFANDELNYYLFFLKKTKMNWNRKIEILYSWWKKHNNHLSKLSLLTRQLFSIRATSASVKRESSSARMILNDRRTSLLDENLENIILIPAIENQDTNDIDTIDVKLARRRATTTDLCDL